MMRHYVYSKESTQGEYLTNEPHAHFDSRKKIRLHHHQSILPLLIVWLFYTFDKSVISKDLQTAHRLSKLGKATPIYNQSQFKDHGD